MLDFSPWINLPLIWGGLIATAVFLYVVLDGFGLGCGILFPFAPSNECRSRMMNSVTPFWDANETWLVLGGAGLFVAFPAAYTILFPALYIPLIIMLLGLVFRGVAFEFRFKASSPRQQKIWDVSFHAGSLTAAFMQGVALGNFVQGVEVVGRNYAGGPLDWANGFAMLCGISVVFGYALLGATWLILKTEGQTQDWARAVARYVMFYVALAMVIVSISMPFVDNRVLEIWFSDTSPYVIFAIPALTTVAFIKLWLDLNDSRKEARPFILSITLFTLGYSGLAISLYPWIVPFHFTIWDAAAHPASQSLSLVGTAIFLPIILMYTGYCYYVFRGKATHESLY
ncbi:MAG: cytochrome d ubiquinol oxidase subunit II [Legionellales bacterium]|nr:cytochrome d ubiquinol oxidase subunit II [Legionellales bacterium]